MGDVVLEAFLPHQGLVARMARHAQLQHDRCAFDRSGAESQMPSGAGHLESWSSLGVELLFPVAP